MWRETRHIIERRLLERLVFDTSNFATLNNPRRQGSGRCLRVLYKYGSCAFPCRNLYRHTNRRGLSSLLILGLGQCEGLKCGISDRCSSHAFLFVNLSGRGTGKDIKDWYYEKIFILHPYTIL